jgi:hypothetical protein
MEPLYFLRIGSVVVVFAEHYENGEELRAVVLELRRRWRCPVRVRRCDAVVNFGEAGASLSYS